MEQQLKAFIFSFSFTFITVSILFLLCPLISMGITQATRFLTPK